MLERKSILLLLGALIGVVALFQDCTDPSQKGRKLYVTHCANCHGEDGQGLQQLYPPLANSDYLVEHVQELPCIILNGLNEKITVNGISYEREMAGHPELEDAQIANLTSYIIRSWAKDIPAPNPKDLKSWAEKCQ